jgi:type III secretory pathway component EscT
MNKLLAVLFTVFATMPFVAGAQEAQVDLGFFEQLLDGIADLINIAIPILIALAVLLFIWGLVVFIFSQGDDEAKARGKSLMVWGIIALFVIVSVWGLVALLNQITGVGQGATYQPVETGLD